MKMKLMLLPVCVFIASLANLTAHMKAPQGLGLDTKEQLWGFVEGVRGFSFYYAYSEEISKAKPEGEMKSAVETAQKLVKENEGFKKDLDDMMAAKADSKLVSKVLTHVTHWKSKAGAEQAIKDLNAANPQEIMAQMEIAEGKIPAFGFTGVSNVAKKYQFVIDNFKKSNE